MKDKELISIVVPVYNVEKYLRKCTESIINQTYKNTEIILVDDGSTDGSGALCDQLATEDSRIRVIHKKNGGLSDARNAGIDVAQGKYIGFIDSDDYIDSDMYEVMYEEAIETDSDIVCCGYVFETDTSKRHYYDQFEKEIVLSREEAMRAMIMRDNMDISFCFKLFKLELFSSLRFKKGVISEDVELIYKIYDLVQKVVCVPRAFYHYIYRDNSISHSLSKDHSMDGINHVIAMKEFIMQKYPALHSEMDFLLLDWYILTYRKMLYAKNKDEFIEERRNIRQLMLKNYKSYMSNSCIDKTEKFLLLGVKCQMYPLFSYILETWNKIKRNIKK